MRDVYDIPEFLRKRDPVVREPKERPILFSGSMVRAILAGQKTQTRRVVKKSQQMDTNGFMRLEPDPARCPYGQPGDRLWVRETWAQPTSLDPGPTFYRADYPACVPSIYENVPTVDQVKWKPSIHMPRALSRILLEITGVRVERLNEISEDDARAEGARSADPATGRECILDPSLGSYRLHYRDIWDQINGHGSWAVNPWVWIVEFRRVMP